MKNKKPKKRFHTMVKSHLGDISRALLEGEKRIAFLEFLKQGNERKGIYALYDSKGKIYYAGKASDLAKRLNDHLKDKHADDWDKMTLFFLAKSANISELEGLLVAGAHPKGNMQKPKIGKDMRQSLRKFLKADAMRQIDSMVLPNKLLSDKLSNRMTPKQLKKIPQGEIAAILGITQGRVSQIINHDKKGYKTLLTYIREGGHRDKILQLISKLKTK
jgi:predicted XRE-type DNA-binding protein